MLREGVARLGRRAGVLGRMLKQVMTFDPEAHIGSALQHDKVVLATLSQRYKMALTPLSVDLLLDHSVSESFIHGPSLPVQGPQPERAGS